jgi:hypothetical protein
VLAVPVPNRAVDTVPADKLFAFKSVRFAPFPAKLVAVIFPALAFPVTARVLIVATFPDIVIVLDQPLEPSMDEVKRLPLLEGTPKSGSAFCRSIQS